VFCDVDVDGSAEEDGGRHQSEQAKHVFSRTYGYDLGDPIPCMGSSAAVAKVCYWPILLQKSKIAR
jgi:hypothetical protein